MLPLLMCRDLTWYTIICLLKHFNYIFNPIGIFLYSYVVDISDIHTSDGVFAVERIGSQLFSWYGPYTCPTTTAIRYGTLAYQAVVCTINT